MASLVAQGKTSSDEFVALQLHCEDLKTEIKSLVKEQKNYANALDVTQMSSKQLADKAKLLRQALNETSQSADPETWDRLNDEYIKVTRRMSEVRAGTLRVSDSMDITQMSARQLSTYAKQLSDRMADIPGAASNPEWQKLNDRLADVKKQMGDIEKPENAKISTMWGNLYTKAVTAVADSMKKMAQDIIATSNAVGDRWERIMAGMRTAYERFLITISTGDWSNFFSNIREAYLAGKELSEMMEKLFEYQNSNKIKSTANDIAIADNTTVMRDTTQSREARKTAAREVIRLQQENLEMDLKEIELALAGAVRAIEIKSGLGEDSITQIVDNYLDNEKLFDAAGEYGELLARYNSLEGQIDYMRQNYSPRQNKNIEETEKMRDEILDKMIQLKKEIPGLLDAYDTLSKYDLLNDENISAYVDRKVESLQVQAEAARSTATANRILNRMEEELAEEEYNAAVERASNQALEEANIVKQKYLDRVMTEEQMNAELERIETERLQKVNDINKQFGRDTAESTQAVLDNMISSMNGFNQAAADGSEEVLDRALEKAKEVNAELEKMLAESLEAAQGVVQSDLEGRDSQLTSDISQAGAIKTRFADTNTRLTLLSADKDAEMVQLQSLYDKGLIAEEEYQKARQEIIRRYSQEAWKIQTEDWEYGLELASGILNTMSSMVSSIQQAEAASLDARMQKELAAAGNNAEQRAAIEEKYEQKKLELQKKYANIEMGIQIAQAIAAGALAAIQAWNAAKGNPVLAGVIMALIAATTAAQVATIIAQRNAIMNSTSAGSSGSTSVRMVTGSSGGSGYSEGGFTGYGGRLEPAGIVHRGEYVVPVPEMRDPEAYSHVMAIERIRSRRSHRNPLPGFADGGYTGNPSGADAALGSVLSELKALRRNPLKAYVVLSELDAQHKLRDTHLKAGSRR